MKNPFQYGKVAENENFIDRNVDRNFLKQALYSNTNVIMVSPRRWGKSSVVKQAMKELCKEENSVRVCHIDAYPISSSADFYNVFAREVLRASNSNIQNIVQTASAFLKSITPKFSFTTDSVNDFSISFDINTNSNDANEILNLPEKIAKEKGIRLIICIDEFQRMAKYADYEQLENRMRSVWQHQQNVSYCLYGSRRHMMTEIFDSPEKPFYRFGQMYHLKKIEKQEWVNYIIDRFEITGKRVSEEMAGRVVDKVDRHSWYVQQLSSALWNFTDTIADELAFEKAFTWCIDVNSESYLQIMERLSDTQINLLRAINAGEIQLSSSDIIRKYRLGTSANVIKNKNVLIAQDIIYNTPNGFSFQDPLFTYWLSDN